jgi:hypothetical protein
MPSAMIKFCCCCFLIANSGALWSSDAGSISQRYLALALQGDLSGAARLFEEAPEPGQQALRNELWKRFEQRFELRQESDSPDTEDPLLDDIILLYRDYWIRCLTGELDPQQGSAWLMRSLSALLLRHGETAESEDAPALLAQIAGLIRQRGFHVLNGTTPPFHDLVVWKTQESRDYTVELTEREERVKVVFMDDFHSQGWSSFATFGAAATSGWAGEEALYCLSYAYDRESETFKVSFLKHESRHLADYRSFPHLQGVELEYRAKLTELAFANTSVRRLLRQFTRNSAPNPSSPHAEANFRVVRDLHQELFGRPLQPRLDSWSIIGPDRVNPAARALLERHTLALESDSSLPSPGPGSMAGGIH